MIWSWMQESAAQVARTFSPFALVELRKIERLLHPPQAISAMGEIVFNPIGPAPQSRAARARLGRAEPPLPTAQAKVRAVKGGGGQEGMSPEGRDGGGGF